MIFRLFEVEKRAGDIVGAEIISKPSWRLQVNVTCSFGSCAGSSTNPIGKWMATRQLLCNSLSSNVLGRLGARSCCCAFAPIYISQGSQCDFPQWNCHRHHTSCRHTRNSASVPERHCSCRVLPERWAATAWRTPESPLLCRKKVMLPCWLTQEIAGFSEFVWGRV